MGDAGRVPELLVVGRVGGDPAVLGSAPDVHVRKVLVLYTVEQLVGWIEQVNYLLLLLVIYLKRIKGI